MQIERTNRNAQPSRRIDPDALMPANTNCVTKDQREDCQFPDDSWVRAHYERIHRAAWMMTGDAWAAEDLAQEVFVVAIDKWERFDGRSSRATWLYGILIQLRRRRGRTLARLRRRLQTYADRNPTKEVSDPATELAAKQWQESVWADVAKLTEAQRDAVTLRFAEEMSYDEIASALGCAVGTAKTRVHHALKRLKDIRSANESVSYTHLTLPTIYSV